MASADNIPKALGNDAIMSICDGVHYVEGIGTMPPVWLYSFPRGMAILSTAPGSPDNELVLVNPIRLEPATEAELLKLGSIHSVVRIGGHDRDINYYKRTHKAKVYAFADAEYEGWTDIPGNSFEGKPDFDLGSDLPPVQGLRVVPFTSLPSVFMECALLVRDKVLITCDSIQSHEVPRGNLFTRVVLPFMGYLGKAIVGPMWMKSVTRHIGDNGKEKLGEDMMQLTELNYDILLTGHGYIVDGTAKEVVDKCLRSTFASAGN